MVSYSFSRGWLPVRTGPYSSSSRQQHETLEDDEHKPDQKRHRGERKWAEPPVLVRCKANSPRLTHAQNAQQRDQKGHTNRGPRRTPHLHSSGRWRETIGYSPWGPVEGIDRRVRVLDNHPNPGGGGERVAESLAPTDGVSLAERTTYAS